MLLLLFNITILVREPLYKATNYKLLVSRPGETMKSMRAGGYYYYYLENIIIVLYSIK